eukprot:2430940-Heterocapsa_arctica.AAC.1
MPATMSDLQACEWEATCKARTLPFEPEVSKRDATKVGRPSKRKGCILRIRSRSLFQYRGPNGGAEMP